MLSSRGALSTPTLLVECASAQPHTSKNLFLLSEAEKVWTAFSRILRGQLIQGVATTIPKFGVLWTEPKLIVTDGPLKYYQRLVKFGFVSSFMTTYDLDSIHVPSEAALKSMTSCERLPVDLITQISGVGSHEVQHILQEVFRFIGESLYQGRVLNLEFPGLMSMVIKRERAALTFDEVLLNELFSIDSRKWPVAVREMAAVVRVTQSKPPSREGRPASAGSTASRARSSSSSRPSTQPKPLEPRPAFCSAGQSGRMFIDIKNLPVRTPLQGKPPGTSRATATSGKREPLKAGKRITSATHQNSSAVEDEESIYDVLSPDRRSAMLHLDPMADDDTRGEAFCVNGDDDVVNEVIVDQLPQPLMHEPPVETSRPASSVATRPATTPKHNAVYHQPSTVRELLYGPAVTSDGVADEAGVDSFKVGRKRFEHHQNTRSNVAYLFQNGGPLS